MVSLSVGWGIYPRVYQVATERPRQPDAASTQRQKEGSLVTGGNRRWTDSSDNKKSQGQSTAKVCLSDRKRGNSQRSICGKVQRWTRLQGYPSALRWGSEVEVGDGTYVERLRSEQTGRSVMSSGVVKTYNYCWWLRSMSIFINPTNLFICCDSEPICNEISMSYVKCSGKYIREIPC